MGPALLLIAQLYRVEEQARPLTAEERLGLRQLQSRSILDQPACLSAGDPGGSSAEEPCGTGGALYPEELGSADPLLCELSAAVRMSETVALPHPVMPVGDGFGGRVVGINIRQL